MQHQYGTEAFGQYVERHSEKGRDPDEEEEQEPELQAIEYTPQE